MITLRKKDHRGRLNLSWLKANYSFSFGSYYDPQWMGVSALRVINHDVISPNGGFDTHPHDNMEILTYILQGTITHKDSMGNQTTINAGEFQLMSAGTGVAHSEYNKGSTPLELLQIWIVPNTRGVTPRYQQKHVDDVDGLTLIASADGRDASFKIHQEASLWRGLNLSTEVVNHEVGLSGQQAWVQVIKGSVSIDGHVLDAQDGAAIAAEEQLSLTVAPQSEFLLFDLP